jgi:hypothetical protein
MSTATIPFTFHNGFLPGLADYEPLGYSVLNLTDVSGDLGLSEATRIYWLLERITFTPSGTATDGSITSNFSNVFQAPDANNTSTADSTSILGSIAASRFPITDFSTKEPCFRGILGNQTTGLFRILPVVEFSQRFLTLVDDPPDYRDEFGEFNFIIHFNGSNWVLYYKFIFYVFHENDTEFAQVIIVSNESSADGTPGPTGTVNFLGYSLGWNSGYYASSASGINLTCSTNEWSY